VLVSRRAMYIPVRCHVAAGWAIESDIGRRDDGLPAASKRAMVISNTGRSVVLRPYVMLPMLPPTS